MDLTIKVILVKNAGSHIVCLLPDKEINGIRGCTKNMYCCPKWNPGFTESSCNSFRNVGCMGTACYRLKTKSVFGDKV